MTLTQDDGEQLGEQLNGVAAAAAAAAEMTVRRLLHAAVWWWRRRQKLTPQTSSCLLVLYCFQQAYKYLSNFIHHQVIERKKTTKNIQ